MDAPRLRRFGLALLFAQVVAAVILWVTADGLSTPQGGRLGGDFPAFYAAGVAVLRGEISTLYDPAAQAALQAPYVGPGGRAIVFPYPPPVAVAYGLFALLPFKTALLLHALVMGGATALAGAWWVRRVGGAPAHALLGALALLAFPPLFRANFGGQNPGLTLLAVTGALAAPGPVLQGLFLALSWFKPHYGLVLSVVVLVGLAEGRGRRFAGLSAGLLLGYLFAVPAAGWWWPRSWLADALAFSQIDQGADLARSISPGAWCRPPLDLALGASLLALTLRWVGRRPERLPALAPLAVLLSPPHVGWYDVGLAGLPLLLVGLRKLWVSLAFTACLVLPVLATPPWTAGLTLTLLVLAAYVGLLGTSSPTSLRP